MSIRIQTLVCGAYQANAYLLYNDASDDCLLIDAGDDLAALRRAVEASGRRLAAILLTHGHFDHIGALDGLLSRHPGLPVHVGPGGVPMIGHPQNAWPPDYVAVKKPASLVADLVDGATLTAGGLTMQVVATPGHTPGGACFLFAEQKLLLTGDTLFAGSCGRTDFPGGDSRQLNASLRRLAGLDPELTVVPGHGSVTTIARELAGNPFLQ